MKSPWELFLSISDRGDFPRHQNLNHHDIIIVVVRPKSESDARMVMVMVIDTGLGTETSGRLAGGSASSWQADSRSATVPIIQHS